MTTERKQATDDGERGAGTGKVRTPGAPTEDAASRTRVRDLMGYGYSNTCTGNTHRSRASVREARTRVGEDFYGPAIARDVDVAVDHALATTNGSPDFRRAWCFYCLRLGVNTFIDQLDSVLACARQGELRNPARAFHARLRKMLNGICGQAKKGGAR